MTTSFSKLLTDCSVAMGDMDATTWSRTTQIWPWCIEAMLQFPILRPMQQDVTVAGAATHQVILATDFREITSVEYPLSQEPPRYLLRKNRLDPSFYLSEVNYDVDRDYDTGTGWILWVSKLLPVDATLKVNYLANHKTDLTDSTSSYITVPDEYEGIIVAYVQAKGYRERLGAFMQDPTAHTSIIGQMTKMVELVEANYAEMVQRAQEKMAQSITSPHQHSDKYDRVY